MSIDIIIPVHNARPYVQRCLDSVLSNTHDHNYQIIIINDASDTETSELLEGFAKQNPIVRLHVNTENLGYTASVNIGMKMSSADYVVLLNSDTEVSTNWLDSLLRCINSDTNIGIVGPLSNAASWQSVPELLDEKGHFCVNDLPEKDNGAQLNEMADLVRNVSLKSYPKVPFVNGFCFMISRSVIDKIGYMDEENFPRGYGEENDYCLRASATGFELAIADDTYVYHAKSQSFGHEQRESLSKQGSVALRKKHGDSYFTNQATKMRTINELNATRQLIKDRIDIDALPKILHTSTLRVLFILPKPGIGGGPHSVVQEVAAMRSLGVEAAVAVQERYLAVLYDRYSEIPNVKDVFAGYQDSTLLDLAKDYDVVVATIFTTTNLVKEITDTFPHILPAYYTQDYEPLFFDEPNELYQDALDSYTRLDGGLLFAKTQWIAREIAKHHGVAVHKVVPSIDHEVYYPSTSKNNSTDSNINIAAMIRPRTPRRGAGRTMQLLSNLKARFGQKISIHLFGCNESDEDFQELVHDFEYVSYGIMERMGVADLLRRCDIFIDLSDYQAFGRTSLEAMACGATALVPIYGGGDEYALDNLNAIIADSFNLAECEARLAELIEQHDKLLEMQKAALETSTNFSPEKAALSELKHMSEHLTRHRQYWPLLKTPTLCLWQTESEPHILFNKKTVNAHWYISSIRQLPKPVQGKLLITQDVIDGKDLFDLAEWLIDWRGAGNLWIHEITTPQDFNKSELKWCLRAADTVILRNPELLGRLPDFNQHTIAVNDEQSYLTVIEQLTKSEAHNSSLTIPWGDAGEATDIAKIIPLLNSRREEFIRKDRKMRQRRKLKEQPHRYFADSKIKPLRLLRFLFPRKGNY